MEAGRCSGSRPIHRTIYRPEVWTTSYLERGDDTVAPPGKGLLRYFRRALLSISTKVADPSEV
jgi:hypothetical protein